MSNNDKAFEQYVQGIYAKHKGQRICQFDYLGKSYWLKQPEKLQGWLRLLKAKPQQAFQREIVNLQLLEKATQDVKVTPKLVYFNSHFLVLEDAGRTLNQWLEDPQVSPQQKMQILAEGAVALANLHQQGLTHGRPALRDIAWQNGKVKFIDLEASAKKTNLNYRIRRDILVFIHSLYRSKYLSHQDIVQTVQHYQQACEPHIWQDTLNFMAKFSWLYYLLRPLKPIAGSDLLALIGLLGYFKLKRR
ncbi:protein kinase family protein [Volucribacter amazonae]|uniref:tRNA A-37 threonylcarbamoyl transferase component Bud32 n=1 Tax=Volucribacter amazonae TaxID=256731 RepID=A0A9X4PDH7_9PAST|nr:protein kinase family protein [Volucribacter amazonae]MDG6896302.1 hypothetical protein [Volucribacter amazonae]